MSSFVTENSQYLANPRFIVSSDRIAGLRNQPKFLSPFLDLPIADYVSQYPKEPSLTFHVKVSVPFQLAFGVYVNKSVAIVTTPLDG